MGFAERFVSAALRQPFFVLFVVVMGVVTGVTAFRGLPVEAFPDLTNNQVLVTTTAQGLATTEVEERVSYPIETALMGVAGATEVRSLSKFGLSMVTVVFDDAVPIYLARQLVTERLNDARQRLPPGVEPALGPVASAFGEAYQYLLEGDTASAMEKKTLHDWDIRTRLRAVRGVGEINSWGGLTRQFHVTVDPRRLEKFGITLSQVVTALESNNSSFAGGFVEHRAERMTVRGLGLVRTIDDLTHTVVTASEGTPTTLGDVATITEGPMPRHGAVTRDGRGETVSGMIIVLRGESALDVVGRAKFGIAEIQKTLPAGLTITPFYDQTEVIARTARTVQTNLLEGSALVVLVLFFFLRDVRAALLVAAVIPLSMLFGFLGMRVFGVSANLMSLGAIDFGLIVDGAVVMVENFIRRRRQGHEDPVSIAAEVARPILFGVLIIMAVYLPIFTLQGLEGRMFRPMAITVCSAIFGSLLLSLSAVPVVGHWLLKATAEHEEAPWFNRLRDGYVAHLRQRMDGRWVTVATAVAIVAAAVGSVPWLGTEFMPRLDEGSLLIESRKLPSVALDASAEISTRVERVLREFSEVQQVVTKLGRPDLATEAMGIYQGDIYVNLHPQRTWTTGRDKGALVAAMDEALSAVPGVAFNFTQPMAMRLDETISGVKADVAVKIFGPDSATLEQLGAEVQRAIVDVPGAADLQVEVLSGASELEIRVDRQAAARYGVAVRDIQNLVESAVGGHTVTQVIDGARRFDVAVRFPSELNRDPAAIGELLLLAPGGERVRLGQVATLRLVSAPEAISHEQGQRRLVVQTNVRGRDLGGFVADAQQHVARAVSLPAGYFIDWGGQFENQQRATSRLMLVVPLSLAIIFFLLYVTFTSVRQALLVILNVPFALVGGIAALWIRGLNLNLSASVGFIALFGVAVLNGIVLIAAVNALRGQGEGLREAVLEGAATRLKPVLMTALVAALGFVPMAVSTGAGAEVQRPLASVVVGGIITSTLLTLIVLPTLYELMEARALRRTRALK
jgi:cobalt-zinc-cadmium resistance protein CzcA